MADAEREDGERNIYLEDIPLEEARARLRAALEAVGKWDALPGERVALDDALGRVTAGPVWARISSPHYHSPYYGPAPVSHHAGFFGTLIGILFLILIIWLAVKIIQALARLILGGNSRVYR